MKVCIVKDLQEVLEEFRKGIHVPIAKLSLPLHEDPRKDSPY